MKSMYLTKSQSRFRTVTMRRKTVSVSVGDLGLGSDFPIRIQSMTTTNTMDTQATVAQAIRMIQAGCELVRVTAPSINEARNLVNIKSELRNRGFTTPLIADIHFTPNAAEAAARVVEKVRINPGNYADKKQFAVREYSDAEYGAELERLRDRFVPLVRICKEYGTALRVGANHGSLSDRIVNRFGDNPQGMVESAMEFLSILQDEGYHNVVVSMKSSNPVVMIEAYRLLDTLLAERNLPPYPLHLGVTEAGDGQDGRIKSSLGIGTLLAEGLGDTVRVSLTEEPEAEVPVAAAIIRSYCGLSGTDIAEQLPQSRSYRRREGRQTGIIGGHNPLRVGVDLREFQDSLTIQDLTSLGHTFDAATEKWHSSDLAAELLLLNDPLDFCLPSTLRLIVPFHSWLTATDQLFTVPVFSIYEYVNARELHPVLNVLECAPGDLTPATMNTLTSDPTIALLVNKGTNGIEMRRALYSLHEMGHTLPAIVSVEYNAYQDDRLYAMCEGAGIPVADGYTDGIITQCRRLSDVPEALSVAYGILQAARLRMSRTEYISCPSCGRTLFDLQVTTALIRSRTSHLKNVKIAIMGCIVNGPGEMADADYGYVGSGPDRITLYRGRDVVKQAIPATHALEELIGVIKADGSWVDP